MRRFTYQAGSSNKFWEIHAEGPALTVRFGKIGSKGQVSTKPCKDAGAAQAELAKLVRAKLGKGYLEEAASSPPKATTADARKGARLGPYLTAFLRTLEKAPRRRQPPALLKQLLTQKMPADLHAFLTAWAWHADRFLHVGEFWFEESNLGGRVPNAEDEDRDDVLLIGNSPGGDLFVVEKPPFTRKRTLVTRIIHDEGYREDGGWDGLDEFLKQQIEDAERDQEDTDLCPALAELLPDKASPVDRHARPGAKLTLVRVRDVRVPYAVQACKQRLDPKWKGRLGRVTPGIPYYHTRTTAPSPDRRRLAVLADDGVYEFDQASRGPVRVCDGDAGERDVTICHLGDVIAVLRIGRGKRLELYARTDPGFRRLRTIRTGKLDHVTSAAGGRVLAVTSFSTLGSRDSAHLLGIRGGDVRLLGSWDLSLRNGWDEGGRSFFLDERGRAFEIGGLDDALAAAFLTRGGVIEFK
jgi:predicted DNA-binding WGR domain protein